MEVPKQSMPGLQLPANNKSPSGTMPAFPATNPVLDDILAKLRGGPDGIVDPNVMIKRVATFINTWWDARIAEQVFYTLSFMLERLGSTNQSIEINALQNCFQLAMQRPSYWTSRQLEMLRHIKQQLDKLSAEVVTRQAPGAGNSPPAPAFHGQRPDQQTPQAAQTARAQQAAHTAKRPNPVPSQPQPAPPLRKPPIPLAPAPTPPPAAASAAKQAPIYRMPAEANAKKPNTNFVELFYTQMDAMNSNLYDVHERMVSLEKRLANTESLLDQVHELRKDILIFRSNLADIFSRPDFRPPSLEVPPTRKVSLTGAPMPSTEHQPLLAPIRAHSPVQPSQQQPPQHTRMHNSSSGMHAMEELKSSEEKHAEEKADEDRLLAGEEERPQQVDEERPQQAEDERLQSEDKPMEDIRSEDIKLEAADESKANDPPTE